MYRHFYGFSDKPFETTPDPQFLFLSPSHQQALQAMISGIRDRQGIIVLTGEVGTGKTTLIHSLLRCLDRQVETAFVFHTTITFRELIKNILLDLGLSSMGKHQGDYWDYLVRYARLILSRDGTLAIFIDEAQRLSEGVLEELLQRFCGSRPKHIQIVLMGQPELEERLNSPALTRFKNKLEIRCQIKPLSEVESKRYVHHRLRLAGSRGAAIFSPKALSVIYRYSGGIPRTINILCDNALLTGYSSAQKMIDEKVVRKTIKGLEGKGCQKPFLSFITDAVKLTK
jgi:general secretion pathway protein A